MARKLTILLAEDDSLARKSVTRYLILKLSEVGYETMIIGAQDGSHAYMLLGARSTEGQPMVDLVITDMDMPFMNGLELARVVKEKYPGLPIFLWTGRASFMEDVPGVDMVFDKTDTNGLLAAIAVRFALKP